MKNFIYILVFTSSFFITSTAFACSNSCGGDSPVKIDLKAQCMCVGTNCFKVGIGGDRTGRSHFDPMRTWNGTGVLGVAQGTKYRTTPGEGKTSYDRDALSSGTPNDADGGKWIHKTGDCAGPSYRTKGCVAVPCEYWPLVKSQMGKAVTYCGGYGPNTVYNSSGSKTVNQSGLHPRYNNQLTGLNVAKYNDESRVDTISIFEFLRTLFSGGSGNTNTTTTDTSEQNSRGVD